MSLKEPLDPKPFDFRLRGHGHDIPAGHYEADSEEDAFKLALANCKGFTLPGWELHCTTTGNSQNVSMFFDYAARDHKDRPAKVRV